MSNERMMKDIREVVKTVTDGVKLMSAVIEVEYPGCGHLVIDVLAEEVEKLRKKEPHMVVGDGAEKVEADTCENKRADPLLDTVPLMGSDDYKLRFKAEYLQTKIRYDRLHKMCIGYEAGTLNFKPTCSLELLKEQKAAMGQYLHCLEIRAQIEGVELL